MVKAEDILRLRAMSDWMKIQRIKGKKLAISNSHILMVIDENDLDGAVSPDYQTDDRVADVMSVLEGVQAAGVIYRFTVKDMPMLLGRPNRCDVATVFKGSDGKLVAFDGEYVRIAERHGYQICEVTGSTPGAYGLTKSGGVEGLLMCLGVGSERERDFGISPEITWFNAAPTSAQGED